MDSYHKDGRGFTLMELLIAVAVIAILIAIAIPLFSAQLERSRAGVCAANRRSLQSVLTASYMTAPDTIALGADNSTIDISSYREDYVCPSGGVLSAYLNADGVAVVSCGKHTGSLGSEATTAALKDVFSSLKVNNIDSAASGHAGSWAEEATAKLAAEGIELGSLNATSWRYAKNGGNPLLYWSMQDVSKLSSSDTKKVLTLRYNFKTGSYTVWEGGVTQATTDKGDDRTPYNRLGTGNLNDFKKPSDFTGGETYENALAYYLAHYQDAKYQK